jgi:hypothetical protein
MSLKVLRWRWCTHVKRPGRFNLSRYLQIDRDLSYLSSLPLPSVSTDSSLPLPPSPNTSAMVTTHSTASTSAAATPTPTSAGAKKKKKKPSSSAGVLLKPQRLAPHDQPLLLLNPDPNIDTFVPRKFATSTPEGHLHLSQELDRMIQATPKLCGDPVIAVEIKRKLQFLPPQIRWVFLMHLAKNP